MTFRGNRADHAQMPVRRGADLKNRARGLWSSDLSLSLLLALLIINILIIPMVQFVTWGRFLARSILSLLFISGLMATVVRRRTMMAAVVIILAALLIGYKDILRPTLALNLLNDSISLVFVTVVIFLILRQVNRTGPITSRRIQGSIAAYLLIGVLWAIAYDMVESIAPGSFRIVLSTGPRLPQLGYFSFTTLATLGLGDILPVSPLARSLVVLEALIGQLFPVILIARLVAMELEHRRLSSRE
ncbi:MAG TPA: potassium channel family protein [Candidatus Binataceae bacterium]|nr:potassium channel family protein [Candidatus Binataceae bacterium]